jgi:hypothetical protein
MYINVIIIIMSIIIVIIINVIIQSKIQPQCYLLGL